MTTRLFGARRVAAAAVLAALAACAQQSPTPRSDDGAAAHPAELKNVFQGAFRVGAALNADVFTERASQSATLVKEQFNTISPENVLKWEIVHPQPGTFDFTQGDRYADFGVRNGMFVVGHCLVWHSQVPRWVFQDSSGKPLTRDALLARMHDHIATVVGHYKGRIKGWDVVNEALNEDGTMRQSPWQRIIGDDFIQKAFEYAHEADPDAELYYNDYSLENPAKRDGAVRLLQRLKAAGVRVTAIGSQEHNKMDFPSIEQMDAMFDAFASTGVHVNVSELDVDVLPRATQSNSADVATRAQAQAGSNPWPDRLPDSVQTALAQRYADLFSVYLRHRRVIDRITFWGVTDGDSWLNGWPVRGRTSYPLLFDRQHKPKPAFYRIVALTEKR